MLKKQCSFIQFAALMGLTFVFVFGIAWATHTYTASKVIRKGKGGKFWIVNEKDAKIGAWIRKGSLDDYMDEENLDEVEITVEMIEELHECEKGSQYYYLEFTFGPDGTYFEQPMLLVLMGKYIDTDCELYFFNEDGEALEAKRITLRKPIKIGGTRIPAGDAICVGIDHFSVYSYDEYD